MKFFKLLFLPLLFLISAHSAYTLTPKQTKNTVLIGDNIEPIFKYGVQIGEVYIETHIIENMTRFGPDGAIKNLLNGLFNVTTAHFRIPDYKSIFGYHITPKIIGQIINFVFKQKNDKNFVLSNIQVKKKSRKGFNEFVETLFLALEEEKNSSFYEKSTVIKILYGFLYKKANDKNKLKFYFDELCKNKDFKNSNPTAQKNWPDNFTTKELSSAKIENNETDFAKIIAIGIRQNWLCQNMPKLFEYKTVNSKKHTISFSDCFETTLHNLCNILAYNQVFSTEALENQLDLEEKKLPQAIQFFYKNSLENNDTKAIHAAWLDDVLQTNIPYAIYNRIIDNSGNIKKDNLYIHIPSTSTLIQDKEANENDLYDIKIHDKEYKAFTEKSGWFGYELEPCTYELIIVLNHILGLNLFKNKNIEEVITKKDFEKNYVDNLIHALNVQSYEKNILYTIDTYTIALDKKRILYITIANGKHSSIHPIKANTNKISKENQSIIKKQQQSKNDTISQKTLYHSFDLTKYNQNENIFRRTMKNNLGKIETIKRIAKFKIDKQKEQVIRNILKKFHLVEGNWNDYKALIKNINEVQNKKTKIKNIVDEEIALLYAKQLKEDQTNSDLIRYGIKNAPDVFKKTITLLKNTNNGQILKEVLNNSLEELNDSLQWAIIDNQLEIVKFIINLLKDINDNRQSLKEVLNDSFQSAITYHKLELVKFIINLLKDINDNGQILKEVLNNSLEALKNSLQSAIVYNHHKIVQFIINLLKDINDNRQSLKEALKNSLQSAITYNQLEIVKFIINLLKDINDNGQILKEVLSDSLQSAIRHNQLEIVKFIINLLKDINDNRQSLKEVLNDSLQSAITYNQLEIVKFIINLLKDINDNGQILKEVLNNSLEALKNSLQSAIVYNQHEIVQFIINLLKDINDNRQILKEILLNKSTFNAIFNPPCIRERESGYKFPYHYQYNVSKLAIYALKSINDNNQSLKKVLAYGKKDYNNLLKIAKERKLSEIVSIIQEINGYKRVPLLAGVTTFVITSLIQKLLQKNTTKKTMGYGALATAIAYSTSKLKNNRTKGLPTIKQKAFNLTLSTTLGVTASSLLAKYGPTLYKK